MARATVPTLLSLDDYAKQLGINPLWFNGAFVADVDPEPFPATASQHPYWYQHNWQMNDIVSREVLAETIAKVEKEIADFLGFYPAPKWISQETHNYPKFHRSEWDDGGLTFIGELKSIKLKYGKILNLGQRKLTKVGTPTIVYSDPQTVGFDTLATISIATTVTDVNELKFFFKDKNGDPSWEIRPVKSKTISGGTLTATFDSWLLLEPDLVDAYPLFGQNKGLVDIGDAASLVDEIDVYREYFDTTERSVVFYFGNKSGFTTCTYCGGSGCAACALVTQDGCAFIKDVDAGVVVPQPATYDATNGIWNENSWTNCISPDLLKLWYRAGAVSDEYLDGWKFEPMPQYLQRAIAIMTTARLTCRFRTTNNVYDFMTHWQREINQSTSGGDTIFTTEKILNSPFGTKRGEVEAFLMLQNNRERLPRFGVI